MRVLLICDDHYHPGEVPIEGIAPLRDKGFEFDIIRDGNEFKWEMLKDYNVVIMAKCDGVSPQDKSSWKTSAIQQAFVEYVEKGGGLLVAHNGTVAGQDTGVLDRLIGCKFKRHPNDSPVLVEPIKPHPITKGVESFWEADEHYQLEILADDIDVIIASYAHEQGSFKRREENPYFNTPAKINPAGYVRKQGKGRVCVLTPGHHVDVWHNPEYQKVLENALRWCAG